MVRDGGQIGSEVLRRKEEGRGGTRRGLEEWLEGDEAGDLDVGMLGSVSLLLVSLVSG